MTQKKREDLHGWVEYLNVPVTRSGVFQYKGYQIGAEDPNKIYNVYRPLEEITSNETIDSLKLIPLINDHKMVGDLGVPAELKGVEGVVGENITHKDGVVYANLKILSSRLKKLIKSGKSGLSVAFVTKYKFCDGEHDGKSYDAVQYNMRANHIALCHKPRLGTALDSEDINEIFYENLALDSLDSLDFNESNNNEDKVMDEEIKSNAQEDTAPAAGGVGMDDIMSKIGDIYNKIETITTAIGNLLSAEKKEQQLEVKEPEVAMDSLDAIIADKVANLITVKEEELAKKNKIASKLTNYIGNFDSSHKSYSDILKYGVDKLKIKCKDGAEEDALEGFFAGNSKNFNEKVKFAMDSNDNEPKEGIVSKYLKNSKINSI